MEVDNGVMWPQTKECQQTPEAGKGKEQNVSIKEKLKQVKNNRRITLCFIVYLNHSSILRNNF